MPLDPYSTHTPILAACMHIIPAGDVIECGAGAYSTPLLHALCRMTGRALVTVERDAAWAKHIECYAVGSHSLVVAPVPADDPVMVSRRWAMAFVDNGQYERRPCMDILRPITDVMVVHDTERPDLYDYEPFLSTFAHRVDLVTRPWHVKTTVVSDSINLDLLRGIWQ